MSVETGTGAEPLVALWADVWLLPGVCPDVSLEQAGPVKRLAAYCAGQHGLLLGSPAGPCPGLHLGVAVGVASSQGQEGRHGGQGGWGEDEARGRGRGSGH